MFLLGLALASLLRHPPLPDRRAALVGASSVKLFSLPSSLNARPARGLAPSSSTASPPTRVATAFARR